MSMGFVGGFHGPCCHSLSFFFVYSWPLCQDWEQAGKAEPVL